MNTGFPKQLAVGLGVGAAAAWAGVLAHGWATQAIAAADEVTPLHLIVAALVVNMLGALVAPRVSLARFAWLVAGAAIALSALAGLRGHPPGFIAHVSLLHAVVGGVAVLGWPLTSRLESATAARPWLVTVPALATAISPLLADVNATHLYNAAWAPHARYHGTVMVGIMVGIGLASLYLTWSPAPAGERVLRSSIAALLPALIWSAFLAALLLPEVSSWPDGMTHVAPVNGNIVLAVVMVTLCWLGRVAPPTSQVPA